MSRIISSLLNLCKKVASHLFTKDVAIFLLFLFLSFLIWLMLNNERTISVPVKFTNQPSDVFIVSNLPTQVTVTLIKDDRSKNITVLASKLDTLEVSLTDCDFSGRGRTRYSLEEVKQTIQDHYKGFTITKMSPEFVDIQYTKMMHKVVPVIFTDYDSIHVAAPYVLKGAVNVSPEEVHIYGTEIDSITAVYVESLRYNTYTKSTKLRLGFRFKRKNVRYEPDFVEISIPTESAEKFTITVPIEVENQPQDTLVHTFPSDVDVTYFVPGSQSGTIDTAAFRVCIDYHEPNPTNRSIRKAYVKARPEGIIGDTIFDNNITILSEKK